MLSLVEFINEARTASQLQNEVIKAIGGISGWLKADVKKGFMPKIQIQGIKEPSKADKKRGYSSPLSYLVNPDYDKICVRPSLSYIGADEYESKFLNKLGKLASIEGCSYQIISNDKEYKELTHGDDPGSPKDYPMVIISVPKSGDKPELPGIPKIDPDDQTTEPKKETKSLPDGIKGFWIAGAGSQSADYVGYGAYGDDWTPNLERISKQIGENKFSRYYVPIKGKKFSSYKALYKHIENMWKKSNSAKYGLEFSLANEQDIIDSYYDERYYIKSF